ncbi:adenosylhomocysteinase 3 isoform X2 [Biomphalaria glabrata]|nr:putative adenosylhomocysteinase 3 isoform X2 [Biomphalaria glabrata]
MATKGPELSSSGTSSTMLPMLSRSRRPSAMIEERDVKLCKEIKYNLTPNRPRIRSRSVSQSSTDSYSSVCSMLIERRDEDLLFVVVHQRAGAICSLPSPHDHLFRKWGKIEDSALNPMGHHRDLVLKSSDKEEHDFVPHLIRVYDQEVALKYNLGRRSHLI